MLAERLARRSPITCPLLTSRPRISFSARPGHFRMLLLESSRTTVTAQNPAPPACTKGENPVASADMIWYKKYRHGCKFGLLVQLQRQAAQATHDSTASRSRRPSFDVFVRIQGNARKQPHISTARQMDRRHFSFHIVQTVCRKKARRRVRRPDRGMPAE